MKLLGLQPIDGGLALALPSGQQILVALPKDRQHAAEVLGARILDLLDDPSQPHSHAGPPQAEPADDDDPLEALDAGLEAGRLIWHTLQRVSRRGRR